MKISHILLLLFFHSSVFSNNLDKNHESEILGFKVSSGAASGYIEDQACKTCHIKHWDGFQEVGMSHSFLKSEKKNYIEDFDAPYYYHEPSQRYYKIKKEKEDLIFHRYQLDDKNQKINEFEQKVDWILGSGNKSRSYLFQLPNGEIFQFPLGWYSDTQQWRMAPGFERDNNFGIQRQIRRECLFCHNAYPDVPKGTDSHWQPHIFPTQLPLGIGCQRCHGPGADHINTVIKGGTIEQIHNAIVNPIKLPVEQRDSVCFQCHLLPSVAIIGSRKIDRNDYSFKPGELLTDYMLHVDINDSQRPQSERFEINHHAYRLRQSQCFNQSEGKLTCISCHNPHKKVKPDQKINHYGSVCLECHNKHEVDKNTKIVSEDCTSCHMPQRRTQDVVEVVMTDHKIQKKIESESTRLSKITRKEPIIESLELLIKDPSIALLTEQIYTTIPILRAVTSTNYIAYYQSLLSQSESLNPMFYMDLAKGQIDLKQYKAAIESLQKVLNKEPNHIKAMQLLAVANISLKEYKKAETLLNTIENINPKIADTYFNFALLYISKNENDVAMKKLDQARKLKPTFSKAWFYTGYIYAIKNNHEEAIKYFKRTLEIDPYFQKAYISIAQSFQKNNQTHQAIRFLKQGIKVTPNSKKLSDLLEQLKHNNEKNL
ncbi:MAG: tetratricopeptide repeat protein [Marinicellaceae bacterium]